MSERSMWSLWASMTGAGGGKAASYRFTGAAWHNVGPPRRSLYRSPASASTPSPAKAVEQQVVRERSAQRLVCEPANNSATTSTTTAWTSQPITQTPTARSVPE